jgi:hypothetical protein
MGMEEARTQGLGGQELIWTGSPSQLLGVLRTIASEDLKIDVIRSELWPKAPNVLTRRVKQVKSSLGGVGISINKSQNHKTKLRTLEVVKISSIPPPLSPGSNPRSDSILAQKETILSNYRLPITM